MPRSEAGGERAELARNCFYTAAPIGPTLCCLAAGVVLVGAVTEVGFTLLHYVRRIVQGNTDFVVADEPEPSRNSPTPN